MFFEEITFSVRVASWTRFWTLPGSVLGAFWPSRWAKPPLEIILERPRADQEHFFPVPEPSKSAPRGFQDCSKRTPRAEEAPRWVQDASGDRFYPLRDVPGPQVDDSQGPQGSNFWWPGALCKTSKSIPRYSKTSLLCQEFSRIFQDKPPRASLLERKPRSLQERIPRRARAGLKRVSGGASR